MKLHFAFALTATISCASTHQHSQDSSISTLEVYRAVIKDATPRYPSRSNLTVAIAERSSKRNCLPDCVDTTTVVRAVAPDVVRALKMEGLIVSSCDEPPSTIGCMSDGGETFIRLGVPFRVRDNVKVQPGEILPHLTPRPQSDPERVSVDVAIDVLVFGPCPDPNDCEFPDIVTFRYYLKKQPDRTYRVVARMMTGGT